MYSHKDIKNRSHEILVDSLTNEILQYMKHAFDYSMSMFKSEIDGGIKEISPQNCDNLEFLNISKKVYHKNEFVLKGRDRYTINFKYKNFSNNKKEAISDVKIKIAENMHYNGWVIYLLNINDDGIVYIDFASIDGKEEIYFNGFVGYHWDNK